MIIKLEKYEKLVHLAQIRNATYNLKYHATQYISLDRDAGLFHGFYDLELRDIIIHNFEMCRANIYRSELKLNYNKCLKNMMEIIERCQKKDYVKCPVCNGIFCKRSLKRHQNASGCFTEL